MNVLKQMSDHTSRVGAECWVEVVKRMAGWKVGVGWGGFTKWHSICTCLECTTLKTVQKTTLQGDTPTLQSTFMTSMPHFQSMEYLYNHIIGL